MQPRIMLVIAATLVVFVIGTSVAFNDQPLIKHIPNKNPSDVLRLGYFLNLNHAQAVIGVGNGDYQKALGNIKLERIILNSGPAAIEGLCRPS